MTTSLPDSPPPIPVDDILQRGETLLWHGPLGFNHASSPVTVAGLYLLAFYALWASWGSQDLTEFCAPGTSGKACTAFYWLLSPALLLIALIQSLALLERRAVLSGRALGLVLLTDRRLIRLSDWPWRRVTSHDYVRTAPSGGLPGVIRFGAFGSVIVGPDAAMLVHRMRQARAGLT